MSENDIVVTVVSIPRRVIVRQHHSSSRRQYSRLKDLTRVHDCRRQTPDRYDFLVNHLITGFEIQADKMLASLVFAIGKQRQDIGGRTDHRPHAQSLRRPTARQFEVYHQNFPRGLAKAFDPIQLPKLHIDQRFGWVIGENAFG